MALKGDFQLDPENLAGDFVDLNLEMMEYIQDKVYSQSKSLLGHQPKPTTSSREEAKVCVCAHICIHVFLEQCMFKTVLLALLAFDLRQAELLTCLQVYNWCCNSSGKNLL